MAVNIHFRTHFTMFLHSLLLLVTIVRGSTLQYTIPEQQGAGSFVADVATDSDMAGRYGADIVKILEFSFLTPQPALTIEKQGGVIRTSGALDREDVCEPGAARCRIVADVAVTPAEYFQIINVAIDVTDINDNPPRFPHAAITRSISELATPGARIKMPVAVDPDYGLNGVQEYKFVATSNKFRLDVTETATGQRSVSLVLTGTLDREDVDTYLGTLFAYDGGNGGQSPKSGSTLVTIKVEDGNDHSPTFNNNSYVAKIPENTPINSTVIRVSASDADIGDFGRITYTIVGSETTPGDAVIAETFRMDSKTGIIYLKRVPDFETKASYTLLVEAADGGQNSQPAQTTVIVNIIDLNDNPPQITVNALTSSGAAEISESSPVSTFVAHVSVTDADAGQNGEFDCTLDADSSLLFSLEDLPQVSQFKIVTAEKFDREAQAQHYVRLTCRDRGTPSSQLSVATVTVHVRDENDNPPTFAQSVYSVTLVENNVVDAFVVAVNATDADIGKNAELTYELQDSSSPMALVRIDPHTGIVYANAVFDFETQKEFDFKVVARDGGEKPLSASCTVYVTIVDTNDNAPFFSMPEYEFEVLENEPIGMEIGLVAASDADSEPYNQFEFSLDETYDAGSRAAAKLFAVDTRTGHVRTKASLDREYEQEHLLIVIATNVHVDRTLSSSVRVRVRVRDQNDNAPHVDFPNQHNHTLHISNRVPVDYKVGVIRAHDVDEGDNARLAFSFTHNSDNSAFHIDPDTGLISTRASLENYDTKLFEMQVLVSDHGIPPKTATATLYIVVDKSIPYTGAGRQGVSSGNNLLGGTNLTIVIALAASSAVIVIILVVAIVFTRMNPRKRGPGGSTMPPTFKNPIAGLNILKSGVKSSPINAQKSQQQSKSEQQSKNDQAQNNINHNKETCVTQPSNNVTKKEVSFNIQNETIPARGSSSGHNSEHNKPNNSLKSDNLVNTSNGRQSWSLPSHTAAVSAADIAKCEQWFESMPQDPDTDNSSAGEVSTTDSGRGPSEEGENSLGSLPPVLGPQQQTAAALPTGSTSSIHSRPSSMKLPPGGATKKQSSLPSRNSGGTGTRTSRPPQTHPPQHQHQQPPAHRRSSSRPEVPSRSSRDQPQPPQRPHRDSNIANPIYGMAPSSSRDSYQVAPLHSRDANYPTAGKPQGKPHEWDAAPYGGSHQHLHVAPTAGVTWYDENAGVHAQQDELYGDNASTTSGSYIVDHKDLDDMIMDSPTYRSVVV